MDMGEQVQYLWDKQLWWVKWVLKESLRHCLDFHARFWSLTPYTRLQSISWNTCNRRKLRRMICCWFEDDFHRPPDGSWFIVELDINTIHISSACILALSEKCVLGSVSRHPMMKSFISRSSITHSAVSTFDNESHVQNELQSPQRPGRLRRNSKLAVEGKARKLINFFQSISSKLLSSALFLLRKFPRYSIFRSNLDVIDIINKCKSLELLFSFSFSYSGRGAKVFQRRSDC